ncbi:MAG: cobyric acid synthase [Burkholderiales bacterium]
MTAKAVMVLGTTSGAGKSWLATALCRWYARQGLRVAPFKAQNMSNNARVVPGPDGRFGEIGSAQYFQALAAGVPPEVRMNPVLLKPERDTASQVVVWGEVRPDLYRVPWRERSALLWPHAQPALQALIEENDVVVIEGAGSPAEINLQASDYVNLRTAAAARASCLLVNDASSGGAAAHLYGTQQLLPGDVRALLRGFVLNRCSGDLTRFAPDAARLQALTGVPTLAMLPMWHGHGLPEEDGVFDDAPGTAGAGLRIAVVAYPRISNLDEFQPLKNLPEVQLCWARSPGDLNGADWIVLPGSKHTSSDLAWLRAQGLDRAVAAHAARGGAVLGICGGLQMLGAALMDPHGIDGNAPGLGLLALSTTYQQHKTVRHQQVKFDTFNPSSGPWNALSGVTLRGYEIHHGETIADTASASGDHVTPVIDDGLGWRNGAGNVLGIYLHGLFEDPAVLHALFGAAVPTLDTVFDGLADCIDRHFAPGALRGLLK